MKLVPVQSTNIDSIGYDRDSRELRVRFKNGATHDYVGVEPDKHSGLMSADSHGGYFNEHIKPHHAQKKAGGFVDTPEPEGVRRGPGSLDEAIRRFTGARE